MSIFFYKKLVQSNDDHTKYYRTIKIYYIFTRQTVRKLKSDCQITQKISKKMAEKPLKSVKSSKKLWRIHKSKWVLGQSGGGIRNGFDYNL